MGPTGPKLDPDKHERNVITMVTDLPAEIGPYSRQQCSKAQDTGPYLIDGDYCY